MKELSLWATGSILALGAERQWIEINSHLDKIVMFVHGENGQHPLFWVLILICIIMSEGFRL